MNDDADLNLADLDCTLLESADAQQVAIWKPIQAEYENLDAEPRGRLKRAMQRWCLGHRLTPEMFNANEGRSPKHNAMLKAFKTFKIRLYGFNITVSNKKTFIILDIDPTKKQNKADPAILRRAKDRIDSVLDRVKRRVR